jgi:hypothetical protein
VFDDASETPDAKTRITVTLDSPSGTMWLASPGLVNWLEGYSGSSHMKFYTTYSMNKIVLNNITFLPSAAMDGSTFEKSLTPIFIKVEDNGDTGLGGVMSASANVSFFVLQCPSGQTTEQMLMADGSAWQVYYTPAVERAYNLTIQDDTIPSEDSIMVPPTNNANFVNFTTLNGGFGKIIPGSTCPFNSQLFISTQQPDNTDIWLR